MKNNEILETGEPASAPVQRRTNLPRRILVVDDDSGIRQLSAEALSCSGYQVDTAEDGAAAWEALQANRYDLLVTDQNMPKVSGLELVKKLRSKNVPMPAILMSGAMPMELNGHSWLQIEATLLKPYTIDELVGKVQDVLRATDGVRKPMALPANGQRR